MKQDKRDDKILKKLRKLKFVQLEQEIMNSCSANSQISSVVRNDINVPQSTLCFHIH